MHAHPDRSPLRRPDRAGVEFNGEQVAREGLLEDNSGGRTPKNQSNFLRLSSPQIPAPPHPVGQSLPFYGKETPNSTDLHKSRKIKSPNNSEKSNEIHGRRRRYRPLRRRRGPPPPFFLFISLLRKQNPIRTPTPARCPGAVAAAAAVAARPHRGAQRGAPPPPSRIKAFAQDVLRKHDELTAEAAASGRLLSVAQAEAAASARSLAALKAEASTTSSMLSSGFERISAKASQSSVPAPLPTSQKYSAGLPAIAYGVLKRANDIVDDLLAQIDAASRDRDRAREQMEHRNYQIAIEVSELEASLSSRAAECESLSKTLAQRDAEISDLRDQIASLEGKLDAQRPLLAEQIGCASKLYDEMREVVKLVDADAASSLSDSVFVWKETDVEESIKVSLEGTKLAYELATMALNKVGAWVDDKESKLRGLEERVDELMREKEHIGVLLRSALQATTSEVLKVAEDGLREAGIEIGLDERKEHRPGSAEKDEVYTLAGALENTMKESQVKIIELQHLVEALRAESGLLRTRLEGQEKEIGQLRKQIKHLEEKERVANESVEGLMMDVTAAEEEIKRWKMAAEEEAEAGRSIEQQFQTQISSLRKELDEAKQAMLELENKLKFKEETAAAAMAARDAAEKSLKLADMRSSRLRERLEELNRQLEESDNRTDSVSRNGHRYMCWPWQWLGLNYVRLPPTETDQTSNEMELSEPLII